MALENTTRDNNRVPALLAVNSSNEPRMLKVTDVGDRLKVDASISSVTPSSSVEGGPVTIGTTAVELTFSGVTDAVTIQADHDNTGTIWIGKSNVDNSGNNALFRLEAGEWLSVEFDDSSSALYAVSDTAAQKVLKMALV